MSFLLSHRIPAVKRCTVTILVISLFLSKSSPKVYRRAYVKLIKPVKTSPGSTINNNRCDEMILDIMTAPCRRGYRRTESDGFPYVSVISIFGITQNM